MVRYQDDLAGITSEMLSPFCDGWSCRPSPERLFQALKGCQITLFALDRDCVVGFVCAVTDGTLFAYVPMLEVVPEYRHQGIATKLMKQLIDRCNGLYGIDLLCDPNIVPFYERLGLQPVSGMCLRNRIQAEQ